METISDNTIYYTLSTIAQTMAAVFAVVGTFLLFQIQSTESRLINLLIGRADHETRLAANARVKTLIAAKKFKEANNSFAMADPNGGLIDNDIMNLTNYKKLIKLTAILSSITILLSVVTLSLVDQIKGFIFFNYLFFLTIIIFFGCLIIVTRKMLATFK
jgi:hypothetical protein